MESAQDHGDLARVINHVLHDPLKHRFVRIAAPRNLFRQILIGEFSKSRFEKISASVPPCEEFIPRNWRLGPFFLRLPARQWTSLRRVPNSFVPKQQVLEQRCNRVTPRQCRRRRQFGRGLCQKLRERGPVPCALDGRRAICVGDLLHLVHVCRGVARSSPRLRRIEFTSSGTARRHERSRRLERVFSSF